MNVCVYIAEIDEKLFFWKGEEERLRKDGSSVLGLLCSVVFLGRWAQQGTLFYSYSTKESIFNIIYKNQNKSNHYIGFLWITYGILQRYIDVSSPHL